MLKRKLIAIFDEQREAASGNLSDVPEKRVELRRSMLLKMARFMEADEITYEDLGKGETYTITRKGKKLILRIKLNQFGGGILEV